MDVYEVKRASKPIVGRVVVPGSKSVTNRALFMAAMAQGHSVLEGALFSDDSRHFIGSLESLGYNVHVDEEKSVLSWTAPAGISQIKQVRLMSEVRGRRHDFSRQCSHSRTVNTQ